MLYLKIPKPTFFLSKMNIFKSFQIIPNRLVSRPLKGLFLQKLKILSQSQPHITYYNLPIMPRRVIPNILFYLILHPI